MKRDREETRRRTEDEKNASSNQIGRNTDKYLGVRIDTITLTVMIEKKWRNEKLRKHKINANNPVETYNNDGQQHTLTKIC